LVNLKWTTTFELNNDHFEIERSTDGSTFSSVGSVKGQVNSAVKHTYQFNDDVSRSFLNKNDVYYRLKQVDLDGKASYTKVLVVRVYRTKSLQSLSVTPNPAINDIKVNVQLNENSYIVMIILCCRQWFAGVSGSHSTRRCLKRLGTIAVKIIGHELIRYNAPRRQNVSGRAAGLLSQVGLQVFYVSIKGGDAGGGYFTDGLRVIVFKLFNHVQVTGFFKFVDLYAQVACCSVRFLFQKSKLRLLYTDKK
jgi:hypothetical protein